MKTIKLDRNGDMVIERAMGIIGGKVCGLYGEKIVYTASGPDDQDSELLSAEEIFERKDEDNISY